MRTDASAPLTVTPLPIARTATRRVGALVQRALLYTGLTAFGLLFVLPFYWNLLASFKFPAEARRIPPTWWPEQVTLANYARALDPDFIRYFLNSLIYAGGLTLIISFTSSLIAFVIVKYPSRLGNLIFWLIVAEMMVPFATYIIPLYAMLLRVQDLTGLTLLDTYAGMMLPFVVYPFGVFLMRQAMLNVPGELLDAARIDGAGSFEIYWRITLPLVSSNLAALAIFVFMFKYNDLLWPLIVAQSPAMFPMAVGLLVFVGEFFTEYGVFNAAAALSTVPIVVVYFAMQRYIVQGMALQGMK
jgi:multiple sugar transport system permease protein